VTVDGQAGRSKTTVLGDEKIVIWPQAADDEKAFEPEPFPLNIVYEDSDILVINKPDGLVVHPAAGNWSGTLLNGLLFHYPAIVGVPRAGIVHRLDKDTSGLMAVAKTLIVQTDLVRQLQARTVKREYLALVWGTPRVAGKIDAAMGRHPRDRPPGIRSPPRRSAHSRGRSRKCRAETEYRLARATAWPGIRESFPAR